MSQSALSRELALRIGLASKALPDTQPEFLIGVLIDCLGLPLTEAKLSSLTRNRYQRVLKGCYTAKDVDYSLRLLQGCNDDEPESTKIQFYRPGDMPNSIRIAVSSRDGVLIDGGFSDCPQFYIYQVSALERRLIAIRPAETEGALNSESRQSHRAEIIEDCQVFYTHSLGGRAAAKLVKKEVHPIKVNSDAPVVEILEQLQYVLSTSPPPWLAKSMGMERSSYHSLGEKMS